MLFSSPIFLFVFLPLVLFLYYAISNSFKNYFLLFASLVFYIWGEGELVLILLLSVFINYIGGLLISKNAGSWKAKWFLVCAVLLNLGALVFFKYANFIVDNINYLAGHEIFSLAKVHLPLGISFFTFQGICYLVDVYRNDIQAQKNPYNLALATAMFPHQIAGPIVRYNDIADQITDRRFDWITFSIGVQRFIVGLAKKILIANTLGAVADKVFALPSGVAPMSLSWLGAICYALQIYFDFSGYSDMAIGLGRMFGFTFFENFNFPYSATSIKDFWRRWHISLSSWFRDYVYISLGGSRTSKARLYINLMIVFFLTGLWHGAGWNFIVWGMFHGLFLIVERLGFETVLNKMPKILRQGYTLFVVIIGWVFFKAVDLHTALQYLASMFSFSNGDGTHFIVEYLNPEIIIALLLGVLFSFPIHPLFNKYILDPMENANHFKNQLYAVLLRSVKLISYLTIFLLSLMAMAASTYNPFIYFRF